MPPKAAKPDAPSVPDSICCLCARYDKGACPILKAHLSASQGAMPFHCTAFEYAESAPDADSAPTKE